MQFIPLTLICSGCLKWAATDESLTEYRLQGHSLLHQPVGILTSQLFTISSEVVTVPQSRWRILRVTFFGEKESDNEL